MQPMGIPYFFESSRSKSRAWVWRGRRAVVLGFLSLALSACSPSWLFGDRDRDQQVLSQASYREVSRACQSLELSQVELKPQEIRNLVGCLNAQGELGAIAPWIQGLQDSELVAFSRWISRDLLLRSDRLGVLKATWELAARAGLRSDFEPNLARTLKDPKPWIEAARSVEPVYRKNFKEFSQIARLTSERMKTPGWSSDGVRSWSEILRGSALSEMAASLNRSAQAPEDSVGSLEFGQTLSAQLLAWKNKSEMDWVENFLGLMADKKFEPMLSATISNSPPEISRLAPELGSFVEYIISSDGSRLRQVIGLSESLQIPTACFDGRGEIPNLARFGVGELASWNADRARTHLLFESKLIQTSTQGFCTWPRAYLDRFDLAREFAASPIFDRAHALLVAYRVAGQEDLLLSLLSSRSGLARWAPLLSKVGQTPQERRAFWTNQVLVLARATPERWNVLAQEARWWIQPQTELGGRSIYQVFRDAFAELSPRELQRLGQGLVAVMDRGEDWSALLDLFLRWSETDDQDALSVWFRESLASSDLYQDQIDAVFALAKSPDAIAGVQRIAQLADSKKVEPIITDLFAIFSRVAQAPQGSGDPSVVRLRNRAAWPSTAPRHNWTASQLKDFDSSPRAKSASLQACDRLNPRLALNDQIKDWALCIDQEGSRSGLSQAVLALESQTVMSASGQSQGTLSWLLDQISALFSSIDRREFAVLIRDFEGAMDRKSVERWMSSLHEQSLELWSRALQPFRSAGPRAFARQGFQWVSKFLRDPRLESAALALEQTQGATLSSSIQASPGPEFNRRLQQQLDLVLRQRECLTDSRQRSQRRSELVDEYKNFLTQHGRRAWDIQSFKTELDPVLARFSQPGSRDPSYPLSDALVEFLRQYSGRAQGGRFEPSVLGRFLSDRARDEQLILYFYPGSDKPEAKIVNSMDRFELLLLNADFEYVLGENYGQKFMGLIAEAWGDELDRTRWPVEIQKRFSRGKRPPTLRDAFGKIKELLVASELLLYYPGLPDCKVPGGLRDDGIVIPKRPGGMPRWLSPPARLLPGGVSDVRRRVFNMRQVVSVIEENLPDSPSASRGGMQVMRNLFWTFYRATPESYRNAKSGESNHLWMINRLVQMGITRELSRLFRDQEWGTAQDRFFEGFVRASQAPGTARLLENLLAKDSKRTLFWAVIEQAFLETDRERAAGGRLAAWSFDALGALGPQSLDWSAGLIQQVNLILDRAQGRDRSELAELLKSSIESLADPTDAKNIELGSEWIQKLAHSTEVSTQARRDLVAMGQEVLGDQQIGSQFFDVIRAYQSDSNATEAWKKIGNQISGHSNLAAQEWKDLVQWIVRHPSVRESIAARIDAGAGDEILSLIATDPARAQVLAAGWSQATEANSGLTSLLENLRAALVPAP